jgi:pimeloyl-ACP methyl ester carboxylesterase
MTEHEEKREEGFAEVNGVRLHYVRQGSGPLALLLHGFPEFSYSWRHQLPFLAKKFTAVAPDLRGYNLSDKPRGVSSYSMEKLMGDVRGLIDFFGEKKATVIAHDWGGVIAWDLAAFHPEVVERLVILNAPHPRAYLRELRRNPVQKKSSRYVFMFQLPFFPEWNIRRGNFQALDRIYSGWVLRKDTFSAEDMRLFKEAMAKPGCLTAALNYYRSLFRNPRRLLRMKDYPKISVPTRIIWAENDRALTNELTHDLEPFFSIPPEIRYISQCSHWVQQEQPDRVNQLLEEFLF